MLQPNTLLLWRNFVERVVIVDNDFEAWWATQNVHEILFESENDFKQLAYAAWQEGQLKLLDNNISKFILITYII